MSGAILGIFLLTKNLDLVAADVVYHVLVKVLLTKDLVVIRPGLIKQIPIQIFRIANRKMNRRKKFVLTLEWEVILRGVTQGTSEAEGTHVSRHVQLGGLMRESSVLKSDRPRTRCLSLGCRVIQRPKVLLGKYFGITRPK